MPSPFCWTSSRRRRRWWLGRGVVLGNTAEVFKSQCRKSWWLRGTGPGSEMRPRGKGVRGDCDTFLCMECPPPAKV